MFVEKLIVDVVTAADGSAAFYSRNFTGRILQIHYVKDGTTPFADGVDFTITLEGTTETVWTESNVNASAKKAPRQATHGTDGAAALYAAGGSAVLDYIHAVNDRVKIAIAAGGDAKSGRFLILVG